MGGLTFRGMEFKLNEVLFTVDRTAFDAFTALLDEPPASNSGLERLLAVKPPWEGTPRALGPDN